MIGAAPGAGDGGFLAELIRLLRAAEGEGGDGDFALLAPFVVGERARPSDAGLDPDVFWRIEVFHAAVGAAVERRTGIRARAVLRMHHEGLGQVMVVAGRLVVVSRFLRDAHAFGFASIPRLAEAGERLVAEGVEMVQRFPEVARFAP